MNPRIIIIALPRSDTDAEARSTLSHKAVEEPASAGAVTRAGSNSGPLGFSLPAGYQVANSQGVKARALRALVDANWDVISVYVERKDLENIYAQTLTDNPGANRASFYGPSRPYHRERNYRSSHPTTCDKRGSGRTLYRAVGRAGYV